MKNTLLLLANILFASTALAQGNVGGGGTVVTLPDDTVVVADRYIPDDTSINGKVGERIELSNELRMELYRVGQLIKHFGMIQTNNWIQTDRDEWLPDLISQRTLNTNIEYRLVDSLSGVPCDYIEAPIQDTSKDPAGCSRGKYTYLVRHVWESQKMSLREKAKLIVHERLRTTELNGDDQIWAALGITNRALELGLRQMDREAKNQFIPLEPIEIQQLNQFQNIIKNHITSFFGDESLNWTITSNRREIISGGAVVSLDSHSGIAKNAYLGIGASIISEYHIDEGSIVAPNHWRVYTDEGLYIGKKVKITGELVTRLSLTDAYRITSRANMNIYRKIEIHDQVTLHNVLINTNYASEAEFNPNQPRLIIESDVKIKHSTFEHLFAGLRAHQYDVVFAKGFAADSSQVKIKLGRAWQWAASVFSAPIVYPLFFVSELATVLLFEAPRELIKDGHQYKTNPAQDLFNALSRQQLGAVKIKYQGTLDHQNIKRKTQRNRDIIE